MGRSGMIMGKRLFCVPQSLLGPTYTHANFSAIFQKKKLHRNIKTLSIFFNYLTPSPSVVILS